MHSKHLPLNLGVHGLKLSKHFHGKRLDHFPGSVLEDSSVELAEMEFQINLLSGCSLIKAPLLRRQQSMAMNFQELPLQACCLNMHPWPATLMSY